MNNKEEEITAEAATEAGFVVLAGPYPKCRELWRQAVLADMRRGNIPTAHVRTRDGLEVWRKQATTEEP